MTLEPEQIALRDGPGVVLSVAREQLGAALRMASQLSGEDRRFLFDAIATDTTLALLVRLITDAEQAGGQDPARMETAAALRAVLRRGSQTVEAA